MLDGAEYAPLARARRSGSSDGSGMPGGILKGRIVLLEVKVWTENLALDVSWWRERG